MVVKEDLQKCILFAIIWPVLVGASMPEVGSRDYNLTAKENNLMISKSLFVASEISITVNCEAVDPQLTNVTIAISWVVIRWPCWDPTEAISKVEEYIDPGSTISNVTIYRRSLGKQHRCEDHIDLEEGSKITATGTGNNVHPIYTTPMDGVYVLYLHVSSETSAFNMGVHVEMRSESGYLSAADWPLLPFYGGMCIAYVILGLVWMVFSFMQWRDLLRVQFWIGGVIFLGMLEKATFYAEYQSINNTGVRMQGAMLFAEWISCAKRTLARMLVVIVSLGFGIVKPRLGATLHRVVGVGLLYFVLAASEAYLRITRPKNDQSRDLLVAAVPLAVLDSAICWWIFNALVATTRTLRLRRNEIKLSLYRHFTNTLIFAVVSSVIFMLYSIKTHRMVDCLQVWKDLWVEEAFWHILFSALLVVIIVLWRPTNNNQRYAFVPLMESADDDEEVEHLVHDAYGVKVRYTKHSSSNGVAASTNKSTNSVEDDLKWLEENVHVDPALPVLDSDEEMVSTRFEVSKMQ